MIGNCEIWRKKYIENHRGEIAIAISKEYRKRGIGTAMLKELFKLAKKRMKGLEIIEARPISYNIGAKALYRKLGFKKVSEIPKAVKENGKYYKVGIMQLYIK